MNRSNLDKEPQRDPQWLTLEEVAKIVRVSVRTIKRWMQGKDGLPHFRCGQTVRISQEDLLTWAKKSTGPYGDLPNEKQDY